MDRIRTLPTPIHIDFEPDGAPDETPPLVVPGNDGDPDACLLDALGRPIGGDGLRKYLWSELSEDERACIAAGTIVASRSGQAILGYDPVKPSNLAFALDHMKSLAQRFTMDEQAQLFRRGWQGLFEKGIAIPTGRDGCGEMHAKLQFSRVVVENRLASVKAQQAQGQSPRVPVTDEMFD